MRFFVVIMALSAIAYGQRPPESMTTLSVRVQSPEVPEDSFAAQPKLMYRAGSSYCRTVAPTNSQIQKTASMA
jgi:hypothetical protein